MYSPYQKAMVININPKLYSLEAVFGAAYSLANKAYFFLEGNPDSRLIVSIRNKGVYSKPRTESLAGKFKNLLLHYALRDQISKRNAKLREYVATRALYAGLPDFINNKRAFEAILRKNKN